MTATCSLLPLTLACRDGPFSGMPRCRSFSSICTEKVVGNFGSWGAYLQLRTAGLSLLRAFRPETVRTIRITISRLPRT